MNWFWLLLYQILCLGDLVQYFDVISIVRTYCMLNTIRKNERKVFLSVFFFWCFIFPYCSFSVWFWLFICFLLWDTELFLFLLRYRFLWLSKPLVHLALSGDPGYETKVVAFPYKWILWIVRIHFFFLAWLIAPIINAFIKAKYCAFFSDFIYSIHLFPRCLCWQLHLQISIMIIKKVVSFFKPSTPHILPL